MLKASSFITTSNLETKELGKSLASNFSDGGIICLTGDLGTGKTTFIQGFLEGLSIKGPHTSPTFVIMKKYTNNKNINVYHIDSYRISSEDIENIGWYEIISDKRNLVLVEWADRIKKIIPENATWISFEWLDKNKRKLIVV